MIVEELSKNCFLFDVNLQYNDIPPSVMKNIDNELLLNKGIHDFVLPRFRKPPNKNKKRRKKGDGRASTLQSEIDVFELKPISGSLSPRKAALT